jgi:hypothetical protein
MCLPLPFNMAIAQKVVAALLLSQSLTDKGRMPEPLQSLEPRELLNERSILAVRHRDSACFDFLGTEQDS